MNTLDLSTKMKENPPAGRPRACLYPAGPFQRLEHASPSFIDQLLHSLSVYCRFRLQEYVLLVENLGFWDLSQMFMQLDSTSHIASVVKLLQPAAGAHSGSPLCHRTEVLKQMVSSIELLYTLWGLCLWVRGGTYIVR